MSNNALKKLKLTILNKKDNAPCNGTETNGFILKVEDSHGPVENIRMIFNVDGSAIFTSSHSGIYSSFTNELGEISVSFTDSEEEEVRVYCFPAEQRDSYIEETFTFVPVREIFLIDAARTQNHTLYFNEPSVIWNGASFSVTTKGGSGEVEWHLSGAEKESVGLKVDKSGAAEITAISPFKGTISVTAKDKVTGETATHSFTVSHYITLSSDLITLSEILEDERKKLIAPAIFNIIYDQWGNLADYNGWLSDEFYWTSEYDTNTMQARLFNSSTGITVYDSYVANGQEIQKAQAYIENKA